MPPFFDGHPEGIKNGLPSCRYSACIADATGHAQAVAQLGCAFAAFAGTEYGHRTAHQRTLRVTMVMTASRMPTIQKRAVILLSGMPAF